jgi:murein DD-endopeptidase MepM/ murein hydrolase activator NlpD
MSRQVQLYLLIICFQLPAASIAQTNKLVNNAQYPCISVAEYAVLVQHCKANTRKYIHHGLSERPAATVLFNWPLKAGSSLTDCSYYYISAHVDHNNAASAITDYNCGTITYDGHKGTDIAIGPFPYFKMDHNQVLVVAAAAGTIIDKHDGEYDRNCLGAGSNVPANYVIIQHSDGSNALYWHMKKGAVTTKAIGQTVSAGEYLGVVGSSGSSSGPHLHFEVWTGNTNATMIDPFAGTCNLLNATTRWVVQKPYTEPAVVKASVHTTDYTSPAVCGTTETLNESNLYVVPFQGTGLTAGFAKFYLFMRNITSGSTVTMNILNPDASVFATWNYTFPNTFVFSYWSFSKRLPTISGIYTFQAVYNGITCSQNFEIRTCAEKYTAWYGTTDSTWENTANWSCAALPDSNTHVVVYSGVPNLPVINSMASCSSIKLNPSAAIKVKTGFRLKVHH